MTGETIFVSSTGFGTGVGKSFVTSLLCRLLDDEGYDVAPFKTLNLTPVTYTVDGSEFGYAQALQAVAARTDPDPRMNPFMPTPNGDGTIDLVFGDDTLRENVGIVDGPLALATRLFRLSPLAYSGGVLEGIPPGNTRTRPDAHSVRVRGQSSKPSSKRNVPFRWTILPSTSMKLSSLMSTIMSTCWADSFCSLPSPTLSS